MYSLKLYLSQLQWKDFPLNLISFNIGKTLYSVRTFSFFTGVTSINFKGSVYMITKLISSLKKIPQLTHRFSSPTRSWQHRRFKTLIVTYVVKKIPHKLTFRRGWVPHVSERWKIRFHSFYAAVKRKITFSRELTFGNGIYAAARRGIARIATAYVRTGFLWTDFMAKWSLEMRKL